MKQRIAHIAILVEDYDEAIRFYTEKLGFDLVEDTELSDTKRWVLVRPKGELSCSLLLAKAASEEQKSRIGNQTGGRVFLFLYTDDFERDHKLLKENGIKILEAYPAIPTQGKLPDAFAWTGLLKTFERAGFEIVDRTSVNRPMVRYYT